MAARILERDAPQPPATPKTFGQAAQEYLDFKRGKGKRLIRQDEQIIAKLKARLGADTPIGELTAQRIAQYDRDRVVEKSKLGRLVTPSTVNRELAILRHLLRLAEVWGYIGKVPSPDRLRDAVASLEAFSTKSAQSAKIAEACPVSPHAPVAQVDRAAVS